MFYFWPATDMPSATEAWERLYKCLREGKARKHIDTSHKMTQQNDTHDTQQSHEFTLQRDASFAGAWTALQTSTG